MEKVFHFSGPMLSGMSNLKTPSWVFCCIDRARYFWGSWVFFWVVFHFIVVPCCPMSQKPRDQFYLASFYPLPILSTVFPRVSIFQAFYSNFPLLSHFLPLFYIIVSHFFHCFSHHVPLLSHFFPIVLCHIPSFFHCFSHHFPSFSPPFPFFPIVLYHIPSFFHCFSHHFPLHCNLPKSTSEGGPGGNRYPTVTQLPPGT